jgi:hypothetical protein
MLNETLTRNNSEDVVNQCAHGSFSISVPFVESHVPKFLHWEDLLIMPSYELVNSGKGAVLV